MPIIFIIWPIPAVNVPVSSYKLSTTHRATSRSSPRISTPHRGGKSHSTLTSHTTWSSCSPRTAHRWEVHCVHQDSQPGVSGFFLLQRCLGKSRAVRPSVSKAKGMKMRVSREIKLMDGFRTRLGRFCHGVLHHALAWQPKWPSSHKPELASSAASDAFHTGRRQKTHLRYSVKKLRLEQQLRSPEQRNYVWF